MVDTPSTPGEWEQVFALREGAIRSEPLREVYRLVVDRLRDDAAKRPSLGTTELLMVERVAFVYVWLRDREEQGIGREGINADPAQTTPPGFVHERTYRETLQTWYEMAAKLQVAFARAEEAEVEVEPPDTAAIRRQIEVRVGKVMTEVAEEVLEPPEAKAFVARLAQRFEEEEASKS